MSFSTPPVPVDLTKRECEVLGLIAQGMTNEEIGKQLFLSPETIKSHVRHILSKLSAKSRAHAVALGLRSGQIEFEQNEAAVRAHRYETERRSRNIPPLRFAKLS